MVTKVYGTVNNYDIIFTNIEGDLWQVEVPFSSDGAWICALYAENDSGNKAYVCKILFAITGHQMKMIVVPDGFKAGEIDQSELAEIMKQLEYIGNPEKGGYCSEYILCDRDGSR